MGTEFAQKVIVWCRTCSGSSWLHRGADFLVPRTPPKILHDKRRVNGKRPPKQTAPVVAPPVSRGTRGKRHKASAPPGGNAAQSLR